MSEPRRSSRRTKAPQDAAPLPASPASAQSRPLKTRKRGLAAPATAPSSPATHNLRHSQPRGTYAEVSSSESDEASSGYEDESESEESEPEPEPEPEGPPVERGTGTGKALRPRKALSVPQGLRDYVNIDNALANRNAAKNRKKQKKKKKKVRGAKGTHDKDQEEKQSARAEIRQGLVETAKKRDTFFLHHRDLFLPLLPERNYITKLIERPDDKDADDAGFEAQNVRTEDGILVDKMEDDPAVKKEDPAIKGEGDDAVKNGANVTPDYEFVPFKLLEKQPVGVKATMKSYQLSGLSFLVWLYNNGMNGILGDEMGLGKTLQTLSLFSYLSSLPATSGASRKYVKPFLVICPLSVISSWVSECARWTPDLHCLRFHGPAAERSRLKKEVLSGDLEFDLVVTSYEVFERERSWFRSACVWRYVVLDEGHKIKNEKTLVANALQGLSAEYRLILTGTPLQNNLQELWALLHWLYPDVFVDNTHKLFADAFNLTLGKNNLGVIDNSRRLLELIMLRRMKDSEGVNLGLPPKTELTMFLPLSPMQKFWYRRLLTRLDRATLGDLFANVQSDAGDEWGDTKQIVQSAVESEGPTNGKWKKLMNLLMQLRKCCDHPYLLPNAEPEDGGATNATVMLASSKLIFLDKLIEELCIQQGKKVLVFSGFTKMLDCTEDFMHLKSDNSKRFKFARLDGSTPRARRNLMIRLFNKDPSYKVMMISTRAGGLGLNLASATDLVLLDSDWNPQVDLQAQARAHRIGQSKPVTIYRLIMQGTVEEQMMGRLRKKLYLSAKVTETMRDNYTNAGTGAGDDDSAKRESPSDDAPNLTTGQLMSLVRSGARAITHPEIDPNEMLKWNWEMMVQKCREYEDKFNEGEATGADTEETERRWLSEMERVETRIFEGKHVEKSAQSNSEIAQDWVKDARRHGMNRVVMIDGHPVLKETIGNNEWEAVKTFAGRDPSLAEPPKRKRKAIEHQDYCQICYDGGTLNLCSGCPRAYHKECLRPEHKARLTSKMAASQWYCSQHECYECEQKTANVGGVIFRCRWCENGFCEDCIDWDAKGLDAVELIGDSVTEMELLGVGPQENTFWIKCTHCRKLHAEDEHAREMCEEMEAEWTAMKASLTDVPVPEMTDGASAESSEVATPVDVAMVIDDVKDGIQQLEGKKRKRSLTGAPKGQRTGKKTKVLVNGQASPKKIGVTVVD